MKLKRIWWKLFMLNELFQVNCNNIARVIILPQVQFSTLCCNFLYKRPVDPDVHACVEGEGH